MDPYKVLQVDPEAEDEVVQAAYRRLAQKYHPDVAGPDAAARMTSINAAWELLRDPERRAALDRARRSAASARTAAPTQDRGTNPASASMVRDPEAAWTPAGSPPGDPFSKDWPPGGSTSGGGYDGSRMRAAEGLGAVGPPPGNPSG